MESEQEQKVKPPELDDEEALAFLNGVENDCLCILATDSRNMCRDGKCYHRTGEGHCEECADGYGITIPSLIRAGYKAGLKQAIHHAEEGE